MPPSFDHRISSQIRRTVCNGQPIFEKRYTTNDWDDDEGLVLSRAKREIEVLEKLSQSCLFGRRLGVVRVANSKPETASISTFEIAGQSLEQFVQENTDVNRILMPWFLAGCWLNRFHQLSLCVGGQDPISKRDPSDIVEYCALRLRSLAEMGHPWPSEKMRHSLIGSIENLRSNSESMQGASVWVHADYAPGNLMWDGRILTPIDFAMVRRGYSLEDATYLIHRVEMHRVYRPWLRLPVDKIRTAILRGLGQPSADQSAAYRLLMIKHHICRLHTYVRRPAQSIKRSLHDRWVRNVLRRRLVRLSVAQDSSQPTIGK